MPTELSTPTQFHRSLFTAALMFALAGAGMLGASFALGPSLNRIVLQVAGLLGFMVAVLMSLSVYCINAVCTAIDRNRESIEAKIDYTARCRDAKLDQIDGHVASVNGLLDIGTELGARYGRDVRNIRPDR